MPLRGQIYRPKQNYPPGSPNWHRLVVLSPGALTTKPGVFVMTAVIRSNHPSVRIIPVHSIIVPAGTVPTLPVDSVVETHQLFALLPANLGTADGVLPKGIMDDVLRGARQLFT